MIICQSIKSFSHILNRIIAYAALVAQQHTPCTFPCMATHLTTPSSWKSPYYSTNLPNYPYSYPLLLANTFPQNFSVVPVTADISPIYLIKCRHLNSKLHYSDPTRKPSILGFFSLCATPIIYKYCIYITYINKLKYTDLSNSSQWERRNVGESISIAKNRYLYFYAFIYLNECLHFCDLDSYNYLSWFFIEEIGRIVKQRTKLDSKLAFTFLCYLLVLNYGIGIFFSL